MRTHRLLLTLLLFAAVTSAGACSALGNSSAPSDTGPTSDSFNGALAQNGSIVFTFTVTTAGNVSVTLTSVSPSTTSALGLGIGPYSNGACSVTNSTSAAVAGSTAQLTASENPGTYCVKVSDLGNLTTVSTVTVTVAHS